jgi:hypothetical protein
MKIVVYAEGSREDAAGRHSHPPPGEPLPVKTLGPAHTLVRRCLEDAGIAPGVVVFQSPLLARARRARGSTLRHCATLKQLLTWAEPMTTPDLAVVLLDSDAEGDRETTIQRCIEARHTTHPPVVLGVAKNEFEAWLIGDHATLKRLLGAPVDPPAAPESMSPGEAKTLLIGCANSAGIGEAEARAQLAEQCDLRIVANNCPSFSRLLSKLGAFAKHWSPRG